MKSWDNPEDKARLKSIGQGNNVAGLQYGIEVHNQSTALKKELQEAQVHLMKQQQEVIERMMQTLKAYIETGQKRLAKEGPDPKVEAAMLNWQKELAELIKKHRAYEMQIEVLSPFKQN